MNDEARSAITWSVFFKQAGKACVNILIRFNGNSKFPFLKWIASCQLWEYRWYSLKFSNMWCAKQSIIVNFNTRPQRWWTTTYHKYNISKPIVSFGCFHATMITTIAHKSTSNLFAYGQSDNYLSKCFILFVTSAGNFLLHTSLVMFHCFPASCFSLRQHSCFLIFDIHCWTRSEKTCLVTCNSQQ